MVHCSQNAQDISLVVLHIYFCHDLSVSLTTTKNPGVLKEMISMK